MSAINNLTGKRFDRLTVESYSHSNTNGRAVWKCVCDCGETLFVKGNALLSGNTKSCGCLKTEKISSLKYSHGLCKTRLYRIWCAMLTRCSNSEFTEFDRYGGRGIKVCDEWQEFLPFYEWAMANGYADNLTIDRIDNDGDYRPGNCRWATRSEQNNNTKKNHYITYNGKTHTIAEWSRITGIKYGTLINRINNLKWDAEKSLTTK